MKWSRLTDKTDDAGNDDMVIFSTADFAIPARYFTWKLIRIELRQPYHPHVCGVSFGTAMCVVLNLCYVYVICMLLAKQEPYGLTGLYIGGGEPGTDPN